LVADDNQYVPEVASGNRTTREQQLFMDSLITAVKLVVLFDLIVIEL